MSATTTPGCGGRGRVGDDQVDRTAGSDLGASPVDPAGSVWQLALGDRFARLHPNMQWRCALAAGQGRCQVGVGIMTEVRRARWAAPMLAAGARRHVLCPTAGRDVPFTITSYAYLDEFGRPTLFSVRQFCFPRVLRRADSSTVWDQRTGSLVDYLGTHRDIASGLHVDVEGDALVAVSGEQNLQLGRLTFPLPPALAGTATVREWWDQGRSSFRIDVTVRNRLGEPLAYRGHFQVRERPCPEDEIPFDARQRRARGRA